MKSSSNGSGYNAKAECHTATVHACSAPCVTFRSDTLGNCRPKPMAWERHLAASAAGVEEEEETGLASPEPSDTRHLPRA